MSASSWMDVLNSCCAPTRSFRSSWAKCKSIRLRLEDLEDRSVPATFAVTTISDDGPGSFRQAILDANSTPGKDEIRFTIDSGLQTIAPVSPLPTITDTVTIDGTTQPGYVGTPIIELTGGDQVSAGITIAAADCTVRGLVVNRFVRGILVTGPNATGAHIAGNFIGTTADGMALADNWWGIMVSGGATGAVIGGTTAADRNVISGNNVAGVSIESGTNTVLGNYIGTNASGTAALRNNWGIATINGFGTTIGGTDLGSGNVISGNVNGILVDSSTDTGAPTKILGNFIGTDATGKAALGNSLMGIRVAYGVVDTVIGGTVPEARNVISGNGINGMQTSGPVTVIGNYIGTDVTGLVAMPNMNLGIYGDDYRAVSTIGGLTATPGTGAGNVICGPNSIATTNATIQGNLVGLGADGKTVLGGGTGIAASLSLIGGTDPGARNVIAGYTWFGINAWSDTVVQGNYVGTDITGTVQAVDPAYGQVGIFVYSTASNVLIGGSAPGAGNLVCGNGGSGVVIDNSYGTVNENHVIQGNRIGVDAAGYSLGNGIGIVIKGDVKGTQIGGSNPGEGNLISGNNTGIALRPFYDRVPDGTIIRGNLIGTDETGTTAIGNAVVGIDISTSRNTTIGGTNPEDRNIISGSGSYGIWIQDYVFGDITITGLSIQGNYIGTDITGTVAIPNGIGVLLLNKNITLGGAEPGAGNLISGNTIAGVQVGSRGFEGAIEPAPFATNNAIVGNLIGTDATGTMPLGNGNGIHIASATGTTVSGNVIRSNIGNGITVVPNPYYVTDSSYSVGNQFQGNSISSNGGLGIDLGNDGVTLNDSLDDDIGANGLQNFPVITGATGGATTTVTGSLHSKPNSTFTLDFYANSTSDLEGERYLGQGTVTTDGFGNTTFNVTLSAATTAGEIITATATGSDGTSEFSASSPPVTATQVSLSGRVFDDRDNDGTFNGTDAGLAGLTVTLYDAENTAIATTTTLGDGTYTFTISSTGTYRIVVTQPVGYLDGRDTAGNLGGVVDNTQDSNVISNIPITGGVVGQGYNFAYIRPSAIQTLVWEDFNNDGEIDFGERTIAGVTITLTGTDDRGRAVNRTMITDAHGIAEFHDLRPGNYTLNETQPTGYPDGKEVLGTVNGAATGSAAVNDRFSGIVLSNPGSSGVNYNFGERAKSQRKVCGGQTASIAFWQNKNGQNLIKSLNGGQNAKQLGNWLAATFPNMYGIKAGANNLAGKTNAQIAALFVSLYKQNSSGSGCGGGPLKLDAQVMATALSVYVTNQTLAGTVARSYGFDVTSLGAGVATFNVGSNGAAFGVAKNTTLTILDLLLATDARTKKGLLYDLDGSGKLSNSEEDLRSKANNVYSAINELPGSCGC